jgi:predicted dehydrogenase
MSSLPIKVGFVGLSARGGWASVTHGPAISSLSDNYTLSAISTSSPESASETADKFSKSTGHPIKAYHGNTDGIASDPDVELVAVAVKAPDHKKSALPAINAGKHVFLEWPAGASLAETTELAEAARKQGIRSIVGLQSRQSCSLKKVRPNSGEHTRYSANSQVQELLGEIGPIRSTTIVNSKSPY